MCPKCGTAIIITCVGGRKKQRGGGVGRRRVRDIENVSETLHCNESVHEQKKNLLGALTVIVDTTVFVYTVFEHGRVEGVLLETYSSTIMHTSSRAAAADATSKNNED